MFMYRSRWLWISFAALTLIFAAATINMAFLADERTLPYILIFGSVMAVGLSLATYGLSRDRHRTFEHKELTAKEIKQGWIFVILNLSGFSLFFGLAGFYLALDFSPEVFLYPFYMGLLFLVVAVTQFFRFELQSRGSSSTAATEAPGSSESQVTEQSPTGPTLTER